MPEKEVVEDQAGHIQERGEHLEMPRGFPEKQIVMTGASVQLTPLRTRNLRGSLSQVWSLLPRDSGPESKLCEN